MVCGRMASDGRIYAFMLYEHTESYDFKTVVEDLKGYFNDWAMILHDKDIDEETGKLKVPHYHFYGYKRSSIALSTVLNRYGKLGVGPQHIEKMNSWQGCIQYLIHQNHLERYQYNPDDIITNIPDIRRFFNQKPEGLVVLDMVDARLRGASYRSIILDCVKNGTYDKFRKNVGIVDMVVQEEFRQRLSALDFHEVDVMDY